MDILSEYKARLKECIIQSGESIFEHQIYCPYCAHEQHDIWESGLEEDCEMTCQNCEKEFVASASIVFCTRKKI